MNSLQDRVAIVTGAGVGLGRSHAQVLAAAGATVFITDINPEQGEETVAIIQNSAGQAFFLKQDVASESDWQRVTTEVMGRCGKIDILVNNAGILVLKRLQDTTVEEWDRLFAINVRGVFLGCKSVVPGMRAAGGGSIINISSVVGMVGSQGVAAYVASKGAVRLLTKAAAIDLTADHIRVNSVHPGFVKTDLTKDILTDIESERAALSSTIMQRTGTYREISEAVLFLASDASSYMTGSEMVVDGGYTAT